MSVAPVKTVGVFGGTFDPVHYGHLRSALELCERLNLDQLRLMPSAIPPHRKLPGRSAVQRAAMVELAVRAEPHLICDTRELHRAGPSYTIDSLAELREEVGNRVSLCLVMGCDALLEINTWHRWKEILSLANIVVIARPGWQMPESGQIAQWVRENTLNTAQSLGETVAGGIYVEQLRPLDISSTEIRNILAAGNSARYLMPESVLGYIEEQGLYCSE